MATITQVIKLRSCPFCHSPGGSGVDIEEVDENTYAIVCNHCGGMGPGITDSFKAKDAAVRTAAFLWNGSTVDDPEPEPDSEKQPAPH